MTDISIHWVNGTFERPVQEVIDLILDVFPDSYLETYDWGRNVYKSHHEFLGGLNVYFDPAHDNMPSVLVECPGEVCEVLGFSKLQSLFAEARLSRCDIAFDGGEFTPKDLGDHARDGNLRCKATTKRFMDGYGKGDTFYLGTRHSLQMMRCYDVRGFTRVELELKKKRAAAFHDIFMLEPNEFVKGAVGVLRGFVDFVDKESDTNASRRSLLPFWEQFTQGLEKVKLYIAQKKEITAEKVKTYIEDQVAATLYTYHRLGHSLQDLLHKGKKRLKPRHRAILLLNQVVMQT